MGGGAAGGRNFERNPGDEKQRERERERERERNNNANEPER